LRTSAYVIAERKFAQGRAPAYLYYFNWRSPVRNGKLRTMHGMELPFVFDHPDKISFMTGAGSDRAAIATAMSSMGGIRPHRQSQSLRDSSVGSVQPHHLADDGLR
jgi:Carboxylesterase type B